MVDGPTETEIKLLVNSATSARLEEHPIFAHAKQRLRHEFTIYYDTDDLALHKRGFSLRVRKSGRQVVQTLKQSPTGETVFGERQEWEWPLASENLDVGRLADIARQTDALDGPFACARPKFVTDIRRRIYLLELEGATKVEAAIDHGIVAADSRREEVSELELEVKAGPPAPAYRLALDLARELGLHIGVESKAARGYRLLAGTPAGAEKYQPAEIREHVCLKDALRLLTGAALRQFVSNTPAARAGDVEGVHQMRVALRRLRTALVLFSPYLEANAKGRFNAAVRKMSATLGAARDWDVFLLETMDEAACDGVAEDLLLELRQAASRRRQEAHLAVQQLIDGRRPTRWMLGLEAWIASGEWRGTADGDRKKDSDREIGAVLPVLLDRLRRKVKKRGRHLSKLSASELHPLRKSIKKLRYAAEACGAIYDRKDVRNYVKLCKKLQTTLGNINDSATAARMIKELGPSPRAIAAMLDWHEARCTHARTTLAPAWDKFRAATPFWR
jgi:triphosphatase